MLLIACLIGYAIAWDVRGGTVEDQTEVREKLQSETKALHHSNTDLKTQVEMWRNKHQQDLSFSQHKANEISLERDRLQRHLQELESSVSPQQQNALTIEALLEQLKPEAVTFRHRISHH